MQVVVVAQAEEDEGECEEDEEEVAAEAGGSRDQRCAWRHGIVVGWGVEAAEGTGSEFFGGQEGL